MVRYNDSEKKYMYDIYRNVDNPIREYARV